MRKRLLLHGLQMRNIAKRCGKSMIVRYSLEELQKMEAKSDWDKIDKTTDTEIAEQVAKDPDLVIPTKKELAEFGPAKKLIEVKGKRNANRKK